MGTGDEGTAARILDAAERRIRAGGFDAFSFRDVAADVGIKSSSVHHHFSTKEALVVAVTRRYADRLLARVNAAPLKRRVEAFRLAFRRALSEDGLMCLCGVLGAESASLPRTVVAEARRFFERCLESLSEGSRVQPQRAREQALAVLAALEGGLLVARTFGDIAAYDHATAHLPGLARSR